MTPAGARPDPEPTTPGPRLVDPASVPELMVVLDAVRRGAKLARFVLLTGVCSRQHVLYQVLRTTAGPVLLADAGGRRGACRVGDLGDWDYLRLQCRHATANVYGRTVRADLTSGVVRSVVA